MQLSISKQSQGRSSAINMFLWALLSQLFVLIVIVRSQSCNVTGSVRLAGVNGTYYVEGRLEICHNGIWQTVCADQTFCTTVATVVCRQLGLSTTGVQVYGAAHYDEGTGPVGFQNLTCTGTETNITQCNYMTPSTCPHSMDAGVHCNPTALCLDHGGHVDCCEVHNCYLSFPYNCWCDDMCHEVDDCCQGIQYTCPAPHNESQEEGEEVLQAIGSTPCSTVGEIGFDDGGDTWGRLVVCDSDYRFKTICSIGFDINDAKVVCKSLGLSTENITIYNDTQYGQGLEGILPKSLQCTGNETLLTDCPGYNICCGHHLDVGMACQASCTTEDMRLVGGGAMDGRLEVCFEGRWGTVCDSEWDIADARVACESLGLPWRGAMAYDGPYTGTHYGRAAPGIRVWLKYVECNGTENHFWNCFPEEDIAVIGDCRHINDASLLCAQGPCELAGYTDTCCDPSSGNNCQGVDSEVVCHCSLDCEDHNDCCVDYALTCRCTDYQLRLRGGTVPNEGRVELCYNGQWGTVCDDCWNTPDARVVCRQLGYSDMGAESFSCAYFGSGTGPIWLDNVFCSGSETHLVNCSANAIGSHDCAHYEDASVYCVVPNCIHGTARLVRGPSDREGQLEVCYNGEWGTVCDDYFGQVDADVACRTIFPNEPTGSALFIQYSYYYFGYSTHDVVMDDVHCSGSEANIFNCSHITDHDCYYDEDVGLGCYLLADYTGQVALSPGPTAGRLRVFAGASPSWGYVCWHGFGIPDAKVVCRELGQPTGSPRVYRNYQFGEGLGSAKYDAVACTGNETHLNNCTKQLPGFYCYSDRAVGVGCEESCENGQIRLVGGANQTEGRLEICRDGSWGTICDPPGAHTFSNEEAVVVCKQLGLPYTAAAVSSYNQFGPGPDPFHYTDVYCTGDETNFQQCNMSTKIQCTSHQQDVGVICLGHCLSGSVQLVDGTKENNGRLEICLGGYWGTICDEGFGDVDARVVCKQLGRPYGGAEAVYGALFGEGSNHIAITLLSCQGHEDRIFSCFFNTGSSVQCTHANDVGVICQDPCENGALRLSTNNQLGKYELVTEGRVELCYNGVWGTVCEKGWDTNEAIVVCSQLGFNASSVRTFSSSKFGPGIGPIYFRDFQCVGNESNMIYCPGSVNTTGCTHGNDAGLRCSGEFLPLNMTEAMTTNSSLPLPGPVSSSSVSVINSTSVILRWSTPLHGQSVITGYTVLINGKNVTVLGSYLQMTVSGLKPGLPYWYQIIASNLFGAGGIYYSQVFFTKELAPSRILNDITGRRIDEYTLTVSWTSLTLFQARGFLTGFKIRITPYSNNTLILSPPDTSHTIVVLPNVTSFITSNILLPFNKYAVSVTAQTVGGTGPVSQSPLIINTTSYGYFQLILSLTDEEMCQDWKANNETRIIDIMIAVVINATKTYCNHQSCQRLSQDHFSNETISCDNTTSANELVIFRAKIYAPSPLTNTTVIGYMQQWLDSQDALIIINGLQYEVNVMCSTGNYSHVFCPVLSPTADNNYITTISYGAGIGGGIAVLILVMFLIVIVYWRRRKWIIANQHQKTNKGTVAVVYDTKKKAIQYK